MKGPDTLLSCALYMIAEADLPPGVDFAQRPQKGSLWTERYRLVSYEIPGPTGGVAPRQRTINWVWYDPDLTRIFEEAGCVKDGVVKRSLLPHELDARHRAQLEEQTERHWPEPWRSVILAALGSGRFLKKAAQKLL